MSAEALTASSEILAHEVFSVSGSERRTAVRMGRARVQVLTQMRDGVVPGPGLRSTNEVTRAEPTPRMLLTETP